MHSDSDESLSEENGQNEDTDLLRNVGRKSPSYEREDRNAHVLTRAHSPSLYFISSNQGSSTTPFATQKVKKARLHDAIDNLSRLVSGDGDQSTLLGDLKMEIHDLKSELRLNAQNVMDVKMALQTVISGIQNLQNMMMMSAMSRQPAQPQNPDFYESHGCHN